MTKARDIASAAPAPSTVSATELGYLDGVSSAIQTQVDGKQAVVSGVDDTEIGYLNGVTSGIQGQLDSKTNLAMAYNSQSGTTYTTVLADAGKLIELDNASAITLTVPTNASVAYDVGTQINLTQIGAGQVTVVGDSGVTVNATPGLKLRAQWSSATLLKRATDTWILIGDLSS